MGKTGTLVVTGPYKVNGVPIRRVDPAYVIATSQKLELKTVDTSALTSQFFARPKRAYKKGEAEFFARPEKQDLPKEKIAVQAKIDDPLIKVIQAAGKDVQSYLQSTFSLQDRDMPHRMKF